MSNRFDPNNKTCAEKGCIRLYGNHCHARDNGKFLLFGGREYPDCEFFEARKKPTVFEQITQSEETLADKLVYHGVTSWDDEFYASTICDEIYKTRAEAFAATVARLKEVTE